NAVPRTVQVTTRHLNQHHPAPRKAAACGLPAIARGVGHKDLLEGARPTRALEQRRQIGVVMAPVQAEIPGVIGSLHREQQRGPRHAATQLKTMAPPRHTQLHGDTSLTALTAGSAQRSTMNAGSALRRRDSMTSE